MLDESPEIIEISTPEDKVFFSEITKKFDIRGLWPTVDVVKALRYIYKTQPILLLELSKELSDLDLIGYTHGKRATYVNHRCRGILCKHSNKMAARERGELGRLYDGLDEALDFLCESHEIGMK